MLPEHFAPVFVDLRNRYTPGANDRCGTDACSTKLVDVQKAQTPVSTPLTPGSGLPTRNPVLMYRNPFSMFGLVAAFDDRNVQAHLTGAVDDCTICATVSGPNIITCPAGRAAEITRAAQRRLTATEILDHLSVVRPANARYVPGGTQRRETRAHLKAWVRTRTHSATN